MCLELLKSVGSEELHILAGAEPRLLAMCRGGMLQEVSAVLALEHLLLTVAGERTLGYVDL